MLTKLILVFVTAQTTAFNHCTLSGFSAHFVFDSTLTMSKFQPSRSLLLAITCLQLIYITLSPVQLLKFLKPITSLLVLCSLHWLKITERIEYKLLSLTYKVLTTNQPPYLHHLISVQPPRITRSSSLVTLARPPTSSWLRITDRCFRCASCFWDQLPSSLRQFHSSLSLCLCLPVHAPTTSSHSVNSRLSPSITPSLFHCRL